MLSGISDEVLTKVRENRLRRMAHRRGLALRKSRRRDPGALDFGRYWLLDQETGDPVFGSRWGVSIENIEEFLRAFGKGE
jgi:hypothetical protein